VSNFVCPGVGFLFLLLWSAGTRAHGKRTGVPKYGTNVFIDQDNATTYPAPSRGLGLSQVKPLMEASSVVFSWNARQWSTASNFWNLYFHDPITRPEPQGIPWKRSSRTGQCFGADERFEVGTQRGRSIVYELRPTMVFETTQAVRYPAIRRMSSIFAQA